MRIFRHLQMVATISVLSLATPMLLADNPVATLPTNPESQKASIEAETWIIKPANRRIVATAGPTVTLEQITYTEKRPLLLWVATIDASDPTVTFTVTEPNPTTGEDNKKYETLCETTLDFAKRTGSQLAINTSAFGPGRAVAGLPMDVAGLSAYEGNVYSPPVQDYGAMYVDRDGQIRLKAPPLEDTGVWHVISGFRMLLDDGEVVIKDHVFKTAFGNLNPRTAVGVDKSAKKLWIVVADGRQKERTLGLTLPELAAVFKWLGAWDALNLDGGGSSTLVAQDGNGTHRLVNEAINGGEVGKLRQVAHNFGIKLDGRRIEFTTPTEKPDQATKVPRFDLFPKAMELRLPHDVKLDSELQPTLSRLDGKILNELSIPQEKRAFGIVDLRTARVAMINADKMFYGASVPKIAIVFEFLRQHPEFVASPDSTTMRELQRVFKRSDNELAAKYGKLVGLDKIQAMLCSDAYQFYDQEHGGGLWCGKYYGEDEPRVGDPLEDLSHAATVRQCLRFYLMLEQDRLQSPSICDRLREIASAPWLDFHDDNFVAGLKGKGITLIRKNGLWENWHLDTARVALSDGPVLLAGIVEHPDGQKYLAKMSQQLIAEIESKHDASSVASDEMPWKDYRHATYVVLGDDMTEWRRMGGDVFAGDKIEASARKVLFDESGAAVVDYPSFETLFKFNEVLVSANVDVPETVSYAIDLSVGTRFDGEWSPWLNVLQIGPNPLDDSPVKHFYRGRINVDYFVSSERFDRFRARLRLSGKAKEQTEVTLARIAVTISDTTLLPDSWRPELPPVKAPERGSWMRRLDVPNRAQFSERPEIAGRICSPTSLSMVLAYHGVDRLTKDVADACFDKANDIYGNWPWNIAAANGFGVRGYLTRINDWNGVKQHIAANRPVVASIRINEKGLIEAAPYKTTNGHLLVICGFDEKGDVCVNDPAVSEPEKGRLIYKRDQLEKAWFGGSGGVAYILDPSEK